MVVVRTHFMSRRSTLRASAARWSQTSSKSFLFTASKISGLPATQAEALGKKYGWHFTAACGQSTNRLDAVERHCCVAEKHTRNSSSVCCSARQTHSERNGWYMKRTRARQTRCCSLTCVILLTRPRVTRFITHSAQRRVVL
jgi:hypothetical protein